jgi:hypothetical protein
MMATSISPLVGRFPGGERKQPGEILINPVPGKQFESQRPAFAAFRPDRYFPAPQGNHSLSFVFTPVEEPQGLIEKRAERLKPGRFLLAGKADLQKTNLHFRLGITQQSEVLPGSRGRQKLKIDPFLGEKLAVSFPKLIVGSAFGPGGHDYRARRQRTQGNDDHKQSGGNEHCRKDHRDPGTRSEDTEDITQNHCNHPSER